MEEDLDLYEKTLESTTIYSGKILNLKHDKILLPNGQEAMREIVEHRPGVGVLPVKGDRMILVKQFRIAIRSVILEIPAGLMEDGESPDQTAIRELQEEIGLKPLDLDYYGKIWPTPGCCDEATHIFVATKFEDHPLEQDDDEFIQLVEIPIRTVRRLYDGGFFTDAKTVSALGYYFSHCKC